MGLESLLVSRDRDLIRVLEPALEKLAIGTEVCVGAGSGAEILASEHFDAIIVDCDDLQGGLDVLKMLRMTSSNKQSVTFAVLNGKTNTKQAFEMGASFVLQKPVTTASATRCLSAALGLMSREKRRYSRFPVDFPVVLKFGEDKETPVTATNLSEGGMAIRFRGKLPKRGLSLVCFTLPGGNISMEPRAELAWIDESGRAGLRFLELPQRSQQVLEEWLSAQGSGQHAG